MLTPEEEAILFPPVVAAPVKVQRAELVEVIEAQRGSVALAEEGQEWVDAVASDEAGLAEESKNLFVAALEQLDDRLSPDEKERLTKAAGKAQVRDALQAVASSDAQRAAGAYKRVTVDAARARLAFYEQLLVDVDAAGKKSPVEVAELVRSRMEEFDGA